MITLLTFPAGLGEPSVSPFCTKVIGLLQLSGRSWARKDVMNPSKTPHGKLPVIEWNGQAIADSHLIQAALEADGADLWPGCDARDRARAQAFIRLIEDAPRQALVHDRWLRDDVWPQSREAFFAAAPAALRGMIGAMVRRNVRRGLLSHGVARWSETERLALVEQDLQALLDQLGDGPFLFGNAPTAADCACVAVLSAIAHIPAETALRARVTGDARLSAYIANGRDAFYPPP